MIPTWLTVLSEGRGEPPPHKQLTPFPAMVLKGAMHCGSSCTLGDVCAEFLALGAPAITIWFGWKWLFPDTHADKIFAVCEVGQDGG